MLYVQYCLLIGIVLVGFAAQFIDGTLGMGYGVSSTSLLVAIGLVPAITSASVHTAEIVTALVFGIAHHRLGNVKRELVLPLVIPGVIGGVLGACFVSSIPGKTIKPWVAGLLLVMGCLIVYRFFTWTERGVAGKPLSRPKMVILAGRQGNRRLGVQEAPLPHDGYPDRCPAYPGQRPHAGPESR